MMMIPFNLHIYKALHQVYARGQHSVTNKGSVVFAESWQSGNKLKCSGSKIKKKRNGFAMQSVEIMRNISI